MNIRVEISTDANKQLEALDAWWQENRPAAEKRVIEEMRRLETLIASTPDVGTPYRKRGYKNIRWLRLHTTPYKLYYRHVPDTDLVTIVAHLEQRTKSRPASASLSTLLRSALTHCPSKHSTLPYARAFGGRIGLGTAPARYACRVAVRARVPALTRAGSASPSCRSAIAVALLAKLARPTASHLARGAAVPHSARARVSPVLLLRYALQVDHDTLGRQHALGSRLRRALTPPRGSRSA